MTGLSRGSHRFFAGVSFCGTSQIQSQQHTEGSCLWYPTPWDCWLHLTTHMHIEREREKLSIISMPYSLHLYPPPQLIISCPTRGISSGLFLGQRGATDLSSRASSSISPGKSLKDVRAMTAVPGRTEAMTSNHSCDEGPIQVVSALNHLWIH